jgi:hypothetical protein
MIILGDSIKTLAFFGDFNYSGVRCNYDRIIIRSILKRLIAFRACG